MTCNEVHAEARNEEKMQGAQAGAGAGTQAPEGARGEAALSADDRATLVELCAQRENMYALLGRLYRREVDADFYKNLCASSFPCGTGNDDVDAGYRDIALYCAGHADDAVLDLARDFARVFIGHGNNAYAAAYPFESVYTSEKRLLMQEARDEIVGIYRQAGVEISPDWHDPEDHVALELEYMQIMARRTREALEAGNDDEALELLASQKDFLLKHLVSWTPFMVNDMLRIAQTDLYRGLARLTRGLLAQDREFLSSVVVSVGQE